MIADAGFRTIVTPLHAHHVASIRSALLLVQAGAVVLLTIRHRRSGQSADDQDERAGPRELAIRHAIGASRHRVLIEIVRQKKRPLR